jgi:hypothetical protein
MLTQITKFALKLWKYGGVEYAYRAAFPSKDHMDAKVIGKEISKLTHIFAGATATCVLFYVLSMSDLSAVTWLEYWEVLKLMLVVFAAVSLLPRVIFMIPMIANMYIKRPKMFYIVMSIYVVTALAVLRLAE